MKGRLDLRQHVGLAEDEQLLAVDLVGNRSRAADFVEPCDDVLDGRLETEQKVFGSWHFGD